MKTKIIIVITSVLLLSGMVYGCGSGGVTKPTVGHVPQGWEFSGEDPYGTYEEYDGTKSGCITYEDPSDWDFVQIYYGDIPPELEGSEGDRSALIDKAVEWSSAFDPEETGTMTVAGQLAGYTKAYDATNEVYDMEIVFVKGSTCVDIYTCYDATAEDEDQAMSLISSIDL